MSRKEDDVVKVAALKTVLFIRAVCVSVLSWHDFDLVCDFDASQEPNEATDALSCVVSAVVSTDVAEVVQQLARSRGIRLLDV